MTVSWFALGMGAMLVVEAVLVGACKPSPSSGSDNTPTASAAPVASVPKRHSPAPVPFASSKYAEAILVPRVAVAKLLKDYKGNELRADAMYKGKRLQITGKAGEFKRDITNTIFMTVGTGAPFEVPVAQCFFGDQYAGTVASFSRGEMVTVVCTVAGLMMNVLMKDCSFAGVRIPYKALAKKWEDMTPEEICQADEDLMAYRLGRGMANASSPTWAAEKANDLEDRTVDDDLKGENSFLEAKIKAQEQGVAVMLPACLSSLRPFYSADMHGIGDDGHGTATEATK